MIRRKIIGLMRPYDFPHIDITVNALADMVDQLFFYCDWRITEDVLRVITNHPQTAEIFIAKEKWTQDGSYQKAFDRLRRVEPYAVFYPDEDEVLPNNVDKVLAKMEDCERNAVITYKMLNVWRDCDTIICGGMENRHGKALRWHRNITFRDNRGRYPGSCCPANVKRVSSSLPMRHLTLMTPESRARRLEHVPSGDPSRNIPVDYVPERTVPFDSTLTVAQWQKIL